MLKKLKKLINVTKSKYENKKNIKENNKKCREVVDIEKEESKFINDQFLLCRLSKMFGIIIWSLPSYKMSLLMKILVCNY